MLSRLFGRFRKDRKRKPRNDPPVPHQEPSAPLYGRRATDQVEGAPGPGADNLDHRQHRLGGLGSAEKIILDRISDRVQSADFELPQLRSTHLAVMQLAATPGAQITEVVELISGDPVLSTELLRIANSVLYATQRPAESIHEAVMRVGLRGLRSMIFTVSVRGAILGVKSLETFSREIWRQARTVAMISRAIGPLVGEDRERAFLAGLLHDIGKVALIKMIASSAHSTDITPALVGRVFYEFHQKAGAALANKWKLAPELSSIAACHHDFEGNLEFPRTAALVSLAHKMDLYLSTGALESFQGLRRSSELHFLAEDYEQRMEILNKAQAAFVESRERQDAA